ncbi:MAG: hypothetical protein JWM32_821 [Verrucomicrobia bacterium]|nr:hypothetical protein [Verrucomicrobiota bacterium]
MILTWHIVWKDFVRFRAIFVAWTGLIVAKHLLFAFMAGVWGAPNFMLLHRMQDAPMVFFSLATEPLIAFFLAASLVYEDPAAAKDPFWVTRPISGVRLLFAKLTAAGLGLVAWPILLNLPWFIACGYDSSDLSLICEVTAAIYVAVVLTGLACASATNSYPRFILWTIASLAAIILVFSLSVLVRDGTVMPSLEAALVHLGVVLATLVLVGVGILRHQFVVRFFRRSLVVLVGTTLIIAAWIFSSPLEDLASWVRHREELTPTGANIRLSIAGPMRVETFAQNPSGLLALPVSVEGFPAGAIATRFQVTGTWESAEGKIWTMQGAARGRQLELRSTRSLFRLPPADTSPPVELVKFVFRPRPGNTVSYARRIADEAVSFRGSATVTINEGKLLAELPVRNQTARFDGGALSISNLVRDGNDLNFKFTARTPANLSGQGFWVAGIQLLNRRTGELVELDPHSLLSRGRALINLVMVMSTKAKFVIPATPGWIDDASFVVYGYDSGRKITADFESKNLAAVTGNPSAPSAAGPLKVIPLSTEILRQYAGTYAPKENVKVVIAVEGDHLVANVPDLPETKLLAVSETRFVAKSSDVLVEFVKDGNGIVTHLVVHQNGQDFEAPRLGK